MKNNSEYYLVRVMIIVAALVIGFFGSKLVGALYYNKLINSSSAMGEFQERYQQEINLETDAFELGKMGMSNLRGNNYEIAYNCFDKTTQVDPAWRDGWVWKGYTQLMLNKPKDALETLKTAEKIDPIYPLTYQLLTIAYQQTGDSQSAQYSQQKLVYLSKTYKKP